MTLKRRVLILSVWLAVILACVSVISKTRFISDLTAFMPKAPSARQQLLVDQFRDGIIGRIIMIGIEGGNSAARAKLSLALADSLRKTGLFAGVQNGDSATEEKDRAYFFDNRYLLSPGVTAEHFTVKGLHVAINNSIDALAGNAGMIIKQLFARDPTGETLKLLDEFIGNDKPVSKDGTWVSRDGKRALLLAYTQADGTNTEAQAKAINVIKQSFAQLDNRQPGYHLLMSGTSVFTVKSRNTIEGQAVWLASVSLVLVVSLLLVIYRSIRLLFFGLLPVLSGAVVGITAVSLGFGHVHSLTLGFGTTLIGEAVDYSIYFYLQRSGQANSTNFWRTIWLGVATSIAGFAALLFSGFPGLAQLGTYSISGLISAVFVTRFVLPAVVPTKLSLPNLDRLALVLESIIARATRVRWLPIALALVAIGVITIHQGEIWNRNLASLSPISKADQDLNQELRNDIGAPDVRFMVAFSAKNEEQALEGAEKAGKVLRQLIHDHVLAGFNSPATALPSIALQRERQQAIPDEKELRDRLKSALVDLPVSIDKLQGFIADVEATRQKQPLTRSDLDGTSAALLVDSLLIKRKNDYLVMMPLRANSSTADVPLDVNRVQAALKATNLPHIVVIDILEESTSLFENYRREVQLLSEVGGLVILGLLLLSLKSIQRTLRVSIPLICAMACVIAVTLLHGTQLTILHLVGLLLVFAIGSNYALFFESGNQVQRSDERRRMQMSLVIANFTTVISFGVLGVSSIPVLSAIGSTVSLGALFSLIFSAILSRDLKST